MRLTPKLMAKVPSFPPPSANGRPMRNWRVKLNLRTDQLTRLWTRELGSRNVEVWSEELGEWVPLVVIPELRESIASASERAPARSKKPPREPSLPPPPRMPSFGAPALRPQGNADTPRHRPRTELPPPAPLSLPTEVKSEAPRAEPGASPPSPLVGERQTSANLDRMPNQASTKATSESLAPLTAPSLPPSAFPPPLPKVASLTQPGLERMAYVLFGVALCLWALVAINRPFQSRETTQIFTAPPIPVLSHARLATTPSTEPESILRVDDLPENGARRGAASAREAPRGAASKVNMAARHAETTNTTASGLNLGMARAALASAARRAQSCGKSAISGRVQVTFAPSGFVTQVSLLGVQGVEVNRGCVERAFREMRVNPYPGAPVSVKKSF